MIKQLTAFSLFFASLFGTMNGEPVNPVDTTIEYLNTTYLFNGDRHEEFVGDFVCVLNNGSAWKVHPKDTEKYRNWNVNDILHVQIRTSFFWFKREHKFTLQNYSRNESVRVMLINYPSSSLSINAIQNVQIDGYYRNTTIKDEYGNTHTEKKWVPIFQKEIYLNDGTVWRLENDNSAFDQGKYVYFGVHRESSGFWYYFIAGTEREAVWTKATRIL